MTLCAKNEMILEVEAGVVGGEEDGHDTSGVSKDKLYTTPEDMLGCRGLNRPLGDATCSPPPSATCTASTSPAT